MGFRIFTALYIHIHDHFCLVPRHFYLPKRKNRTHSVATLSPWQPVIFLSLRIYLFYFFMCLLAICIPYLDEYLCKSFAYFNNRVVFLFLNCRCSYILDTGPLLNIWFSNIFSHYLFFLFTFLILSFGEQKFYF